jgi:hypothetical protein
MSAGDRAIAAWLAGETPVPEAVPETEPPAERKRLPRGWPVLLVALPASVAIWSGWVGIGAKCGFGYVTPLPGIADHFRLDTAITLPVGVEAYGAYALGVWLNPDTPLRARRFAMWSSVGSLLLGILGQVAFHLLTAAGYARAPWPVIVAVSCIPVIALGFAAALAHLLRVPAAKQSAHPVPAAGAGVPEPPAALNGHAAAARELFAERTGRGEVPGVRAIRKGLHVGQERAQQVREYLRDLAAASGGGSHE